MNDIFTHRVVWENRKKATRKVIAANYNPLLFLSSSLLLQFQLLLLRLILSLRNDLTCEKICGV